MSAIHQASYEWDKNMMIGILLTIAATFFLCVAIGLGFAMFAPGPSVDHAKELSSAKCLSDCELVKNK